MGDIPHDFFLLNDGKHKWNEQYAPIPHNHRPINHITPDIIPDVVLSQHKFGQFQQLAPIARQYRVPLISLEHTLPNPKFSKTQLIPMKQMCGNVNVFLSNYSVHKWDYDCLPNVVVIPQAIDTELFVSTCKKRELKILSVVNNFKERNAECNYDDWLKIVHNLPHKLIGSSTCGLSQPTKSITELVRQYNTYMLFLNTSRVSTMPFTLFEAMACGCCCISSNTSMIPEVIDHGYNGFLYDINKPTECRLLIKELLQSPKDLLIEIGQRARQTVEQKFSKSHFVQRWTKLLMETHNGQNTHHT